MRHVRDAAVAPAARQGSGGGNGRKPAMVFQLALPHYRQALLDALARQSAPLRFYVGDQQFPTDVVNEVQGEAVVTTGANVFLAGRRLAWQRTPWREALRARCVVVEVNPRILSAWLLLLLRRLCGRRTLGWGHVLARRGPGARTEPVRRLMRAMLDGMIVYTDTEKAVLGCIHPGLDCWVAANAVYASEQMRPFPPQGPPRDFVCIGRLVPEKRPMLALEAFAAAQDRMPGSRLLFIGTGPERGRLDRAVERQGLHGDVVILGHVTNHNELARTFAGAVATVSPGYVGLNAIQSLGFGVPVVYPDGDLHAPEVEALDTSNSWTFPSVDVDGLAAAMTSAWNSRQGMLERREALAASTRSRYSADAMASTFVEAVRGPDGGDERRCG